MTHIVGEYGPVLDSVSVESWSSNWYSCMVSIVLKRNLVLTVAMIQSYQITSAHIGQLLDPNLLQTLLDRTHCVTGHFVCEKS